MLDWWQLKGGNQAVMLSQSLLCRTGCFVFVLCAMHRVVPASGLGYVIVTNRVRDFPRESVSHSLCCRHCLCLWEVFSDRIGAVPLLIAPRMPLELRVQHSQHTSFLTAVPGVCALSTAGTGALLDSAWGPLVPISSRHSPLHHKTVFVSSLHSTSASQGSIRLLFSSLVFGPIP